MVIQVNIMHQPSCAASLCFLIYVSYIAETHLVEETRKGAVSCTIRCCREGERLRQGLDPNAQSCSKRQDQGSKRHVQNTCCQCLELQTWCSCIICDAHPAKRETKRREKEKTMPFGVNLMRSQVLYRAHPASLVPEAVSAWRATSPSASLDPNTFTTLSFKHLPPVLDRTVLRAAEPTLHKHNRQARC